VQDLSGRVPGLVPTSMSNGGEVHDNSLAMALPGSVPVSAPAPGAGQSPETIPLPQLGAQVPVSTERDRVHGARQPAGEPADPPGRFGGITVGSGTDKPGGGWKLSPSAGGGTS
jgi:hypothetical protein